MTQLMVRSEHLHEARRRHGGYCVRGVGPWFERHGMTLRHFLQHGYPIEQIEAIKDEFGLRVARIAREQGDQ